MKLTLLATTVALSLVASSAYATGMAEHLMPVAFGPIHAMTVQGHEMHVQGIKDKKGGEWVVMSRADAEALMGQKFDEKFEFYRVHMQGN